MRSQSECLTSLARSSSSWYPAWHVCWYSRSVSPLSEMSVCHADVKAFGVDLLFLELIQSSDHEIIGQRHGECRMRSLTISGGYSDLKFLLPTTPVKKTKRFRGSLFRENRPVRAHAHRRDEARSSLTIQHVCACSPAVDMLLARPVPMTTGHLEPQGGQ